MKRMTGASFVLIVAILTLTPNALAQKAKCAQSTITKLEDDSDRARSWQELYRFYQKYRACDVDDATVEEGYSESVARILVDSWETLPGGARLMRRDPHFRDFVFEGINVTLNLEDIENIAKKSSEACPKSLKSLCLRLNQATQEARKG